MMIPPELYIEELENADYLELIEERNRLISRIKSFEMDDMKDKGGIEMDVCPSPDVRYQFNLKYLAQLCNLMQEKYRCEYAWVGRRLRDDMKKQTSE